MLERSKEYLEETVKRRNKFPPQFRMYLKQDDVPNWKTLKVIAKRESRSVAEVIRELVESYVRLHSPGNPQQTMDFALANGKPYVAPRKCGFKGCGGSAFGFALHLKSGKRFALCKMHFENAEQTAAWKVER